MPRRFAAAAAAGAVLALVPATPAAAHGQDAPVAGDYLVTVTAIEPALPGVRARAVEAGASLELTNSSARTVEILGLSGEPFLRLRPGGVEENRRSPTLYASRTLRGAVRPPADADPAAAADWRRTSAAPAVRWHDERARWDAPLPAEVTANRGAARRLRTWSVPLLVDAARTAVIRGTIDWVPPPETGAWWAASLAAAALIGLVGAVPAPMGGRRATALRWLLAGMAVGCGLAAAGLTVALAVAATTPGTVGSAAQLVARIWPLVTGLGMLAAGVAMALRRSAADFAFAIAGGCVSFTAGIANGAVFSHSVVALPVEAYRVRLAVAAVIASGLGLTAVGALRWYRNTPKGADARLS